MNINKLYNYNKNIINDIDLFLNENKIENKFLIIAKLDEIMSSKNIKENLYTKLNKENKEIIFSTPNKPISQAITPNNVHIIEHNVSLYINESKQSNFIRDYTVIEEKLFNGGKYIGEIRNEKREGKGKMFYNDGTTYEGEYKNDLRNGYGIFNINKVIDMKVILEIINMMEKEQCIILMGINMKDIGLTIKEMVKDQCIIK